MEMRNVETCQNYRTLRNIKKQSTHWTLTDIKNSFFFKAKCKFRIILVGSSTRVIDQRVA